MSKNRSRNATPQTPKEWQHVQIEQDGPLFKLTTGVFSSMIGWQTCKAAGIESGNKLGLQEALTAGSKLEKWLAKQEGSK